MPFAQMIDVSFAKLGVDAFYTPEGGAPVAVRVITRRPDQIIGFGETQLHAETTVLDLRVSEVAHPRSGDTVDLGGTTYVVQGKPVRNDPDRLVWTLDVRPA